MPKKGGDDRKDIEYIRHQRKEILYMPKTSGKQVKIYKKPAKSQWSKYKIQRQPVCCDKKLVP